MKKDKIEVVLVLGIRPDIIRASLIIEMFRAKLGNRFSLVWSGQHYSENLKDVFFTQLNVSPPDFELSITGNNDAELVSNMIRNLSRYLEDVNPRVVLFLGDTNTVMGAISSAQLNIPTFHIEGCMRSYDWRMPEEKYRTIADHLSNRIYAYLEEYKQQGLAEGIPEEIIRVCGNPIVDVLENFFLSGKLRLTREEKFNLLGKYGLASSDFLLMTAHRRENVTDRKSLQRIMKLANAIDNRVLFPAGYRTQKQLKYFSIPTPDNVLIIDPIGYLEILELMFASQGVLTDSGTIVEEAAILGVPSIQMRRSTERPQVYDIGASVKFDPTSEQNYIDVIEKIKGIVPHSWNHNFGDGTASETIVEDVMNSLENKDLFGRAPELYSPHSLRAFTY